MSPKGSVAVNQESTTQRTYVLISPCRNEQEYMRRTLESVVNQSETPSLWVIVDDGSTDATPDILKEYSEHHHWIRVMKKPNRGHRAVGPGVVEAFYFGLDQIDIEAFNYLCKLDLDLDLPETYFETLINRMEQNPRIGSCSGKPYFKDAAGKLVSERCGDEMSVGMTKFYRKECFEQIGGFVREVMWDAIDCHKSRQLGWIACSWDDEHLRFEHLRPMGSSEKSILTGRMRHGFGQYYMGSDPFYFTATAIFRMGHPPLVIGGIAMLWGFFRSFLTRAPRQKDKELISFIRKYQRRALIVGKAKSIREIEESTADRWKAVAGTAA